MGYTQFSPHISILRTISDKRLGITELFKATELRDKNDFKIALNDLKSARMVTGQTDPKHKQREIILLTELGGQFKGLVESADQYCKDYKEFLIEVSQKALIFEHEIIGDPLFLSIKATRLHSDKERNMQRMLKQKMKMQGWTDEEIIFSGECFRNILQIKHVFVISFFFILIFRFQLIKFRFNPLKRSEKVIDVSTQEMIKNILFELMKELISRNLDFNDTKRLAIMEFNGFPNITPIDEYEYHMLKKPVEGGIYGILYDALNLFLYPFPFVMHEVIGKLLRSYISLITPIFISNAGKHLLEIFRIFRADIQSEEEKLKKLQELTQDQLKKLTLKGNGNFFEYQFTNKDIRDYCKLKIRSMSFFDRHGLKFMERELKQLSEISQTIH